MLGLMYLCAAALFISLMYFVVRWAWRKGRADGGSILKACGYALVGFLVVYLPVFWNWIPVVVAHRHLCDTDAGFVAYKTPQQWIAENRDQLRTLIGVDLEKATKSQNLPSGFSRYEFFGGLLAEESRSEEFHRYGMEFRRSESRIIDVRTNATLTQQVNYSVGSWEDARIWLTQRSCFRPGKSQPSDKRNAFTSKLKEGIK